MHSSTVQRIHCKRAFYFYTKCYYRYSIHDAWVPVEVEVYCSDSRPERTRKETEGRDGQAQSHRGRRTSQEKARRRKVART